MGNELQIKKFKNAFGIKMLNVNHTSNGINNSLDCNLIYAANGVFKTSFCKTIDSLSRGEPVEDRITEDSLEYELYIGGTNVDSIDNLEDKVLVFTNDLINEIKMKDLNDELSRIAAVDGLTIRIKKVYDAIDENINNLMDCVTSLGYDSSVLNLFTDVQRENKFEYLKSIVDKIFATETIEGKKLKIEKKLFASTTYAKLDNNETREKIEDIIDYTNKIQKETIFDDNFTVFAASELLKGLKDSSYLSKEKNRGIVLQEETYYSYEEFESTLNEHISKILETPEAKEKINSVLNTIGKKKKEEKKLRKDIFEDSNLIEALRYSRVQWIASELKISFLNKLNEMSKIIKEQEKEVQIIRADAESSKSKFEEAIDIYQDRFNPIFEIKIKNRTSVVLGIELPIFCFKHKSQPTSEINEDKLVEILSSGEQTAYNVLIQMM